MTVYRVAFLTDSREMGGAEVVLRTLVQHLPDEAVPVVLAHDASVLASVTAGRPGCVGEVVPRALWAALAALRRHRPDVVHANLTTFTSCRTLVLASLLLRLPVVLVDHLPTPGLTWRGRAVQRAVTRAAALRVSVGVEAARLTELFGGLPYGSVEVIPNGVVEVEAPPPPLPDGDRCVLGFLGRLEPQKGADLLLRALVDVPAACLLIMGSGSQRDSLSALTAQLGVGDRVELLDGQLDTRAFWKCIDVLVLPSRAEAMPLVLLEAMHRGRPVIATDVGSVREVVTPDVGLLVPSEDVTALTAALKALVDDPAARRRLGDAARGAAVTRWSASRMASAYDSAYRRVISGCSPADGQRAHQR